MVSKEKKGDGRQPVIAAPAEGRAGVFCLGGPPKRGQGDPLVNGENERSVARVRNAFAPAIYRGKYKGRSHGFTKKRMLAPGEAASLVFLENSDKDGFIS
jgi:hypothetical protein